MIQAIIFDWGGVLIQDPTPEFVRFFSSYFHVPKKKFLSTYKNYLSAFQKNLITEQEFWNLVCSVMNVSAPREDLWKKVFKHAYQENQNMFLLVSTLKKKGYRIGLLSNTEQPVLEFFYEQRYPHFDTIVFSCTEHVVKPDKKIYTIMLDRLDLTPGECVFIDDQKTNVVSAVEMGLYGIVFHNITQCVQDLEKLGISINNKPNTQKRA